MRSTEIAENSEVADQIGRAPWDGILRNLDILGPKPDHNPSPLDSLSRSRPSVRQDPTGDESGVASVN